MTKKGGVAIDKWKQSIFERRLHDAGFNYTTGPGITKDTLLITVPYEEEDFDALAGVIKASEAECRSTRNG